MSRFHFALERVLRVRHIEQDLARTAWSDAERAARAARDAVAGLATRIEAEQIALCAEQRAGRWNAAEILRRFECLDRLRGALVDAARVVAEREAVAERARIEWNSRRSDERGIEKLEHRRRAAHDLETLHSENAFIDEQASMRAARQHSAPPARSTGGASARNAPRSNAGSSPVQEA